MRFWASNSIPGDDAYRWWWCVTSRRVAMVTRACLSSLHIPIRTVCRRTIFTARRYANAIYAVVVCPSVYPSVRHTPVLYQNGRLNIGSRKQRHTIAQGLEWVEDSKYVAVLTPNSQITWLGTCAVCAVWCLTQTEYLRSHSTSTF